MARLDSKRTTTRGRGAIARHVAGLGAAAALACLAGGAAVAQDADSPLKNVMKTLGFATDLPEPPDFVVKARPPTEPDYIPIFQAPPEPARPVLKSDDLGKMKGDLDSVQKRHDAIRGAFPPSAKALAEEKAEAAKKAKAKAQAAGQ